MNVLDVKQAAELLKIHPETLKVKAASKEIPGAKIGRAWVFIDDDLVDYIRSKYNIDRQPIKPQENEEKVCSINAKIQKIGTLASPLMAQKYTEALALQTARKPKK